MSAIAEHQSRSPGPAGKRGRPVLSRRGAAYWLSGLLAVTATVNCLLTFLVPGILRGTAVMNGSARGTALAVLLLGVPVLAVSMAPAWAGSFPGSRSEVRTALITGSSGPVSCGGRGCRLGT